MNTHDLRYDGCQIALACCSTLNINIRHLNVGMSNVRQDKSRQGNTYGETWPRSSPSFTRATQDWHMPARNWTQASTVGGKYYSKELFEQPVDSYAEHLRMSPRQYYILEVPISGLDSYLAECLPRPTENPLRRRESETSNSSYLYNILKSYLTSGQCYEGNIFLVALPCSLFQGG